MLTCERKLGMISPLGAAWAITPCCKPEYWTLLVAGILELQQNGLQVTKQVVRQLEVQVPKTAGATPGKNLRVFFYYPTLLCALRMTRETSTNMLRYS